MTTAKRIDEAKLKADLEKLGGFRFEKLRYEEEDHLIKVMLTVRFFGETVSAMKSLLREEVHYAAFNIWDYVASDLIAKVEEYCSNVANWAKRPRLVANFAAYRKIDRALAEIHWPEVVDIQDVDELGLSFAVLIWTRVKGQVRNAWVNCDKSVRGENCAEALKAFQRDVTGWLSRLDSGIPT